MLLKPSFCARRGVPVATARCTTLLGDRCISAPCLLPRRWSAGPLLGLTPRHASEQPRCAGEGRELEPNVLSGSNGSAASGDVFRYSSSGKGAAPTPAIGNASSGSSGSLQQLETTIRASSTSVAETVVSYSDFYRCQNTAFADQPGSSASADASSSSSSSSNSHDAALPFSASHKPQDQQQQAQQQQQHPPRDVDEAIAKAQQALQAAEVSLSSIEQLQSSMQMGPGPLFMATLRTVRSAMLLAAMALLMVFSHASGLVWQWVGAAVGAMAIAGWGYRRSSLSKSGAAAAMVVGCATLACSLRFGAALLAFYFSSSKLTTFKEELKEGVDEHSKKSGQRDWVQVLCNALVPSLLSLAYGALAGCVDVPLGPSPSLEPLRSDLITLIMGGFLGYYACCCGDTWASELGVLSKDTPRLITTLRPVRRGTNGGVTLLGLSASVAGGLFVGLVFYAAALVSPTLWIFPQQREVAMSQWNLIPLGLLAGLFGSLLDSLLGATVQYTGYSPMTGKVTSRPAPGVVHISGLPFLDNNLVNLVSASLTSLLTAFLALRLFG